MIELTSTFGSNGPAERILHKSVIEAFEPFIFQFPPTQNLRPIFNAFFQLLNK